MPRLWRCAVRRAGSSLLAALTLLPLLASAHHHSADQARAPQSCPVCTVKADSTAVTAPRAPQLAPVLRSVVVVPASTAVPGFVHRPARAGRAPPLAPPTYRA